MKILVGPWQAAKQAQCSCAWEESPETPQRNT